MGKVASDKCHKWVFKEPSESEPNLANYWQSSFDAVCFLSLPQIFKYFLFWLDEKFMIKMVTPFGCSKIYCSFLQNGQTNLNQAYRSTVKHPFYMFFFKYFFKL